MNKKVSFVLIVALVLMAAVVFADKALQWRVYINGVESQIIPLNYKNKIYLPLDQAAEALKLKVASDPSKSAIELTSTETEEPKNPPPQIETGSITGNVKFNINEETTLSFESKEAILTACADKPFTGKELKNHFFDGQSSYFYHHIPLYSTQIDKDGNFTLSNIKPGDYDLLVFNKREAPFGYQRVAWKIYVNVEQGEATKVKLDNYNRALDDFVYMQQ